jgi:transcriptional regulator with GAF, ATPase, and Fis domain
VAVVERDDDFRDEQTLLQVDAESVNVARCQPRLDWTDVAGPHSLVLGATAVVGSSPGVDVVVADPAVSRLHTELEPRADGLWVRDLSSRNGTFVQEVLVTQARVPEGGQLRVGSTRIQVRYASATTDVDVWPGERFGPLLGRSVVMRELFARIARVAPTESTVLVQGETGTGKELVATAIHEASGRAHQPMIVIDCASVPEHLLEDELFGHARGAFTGAVGARAGALELAAGGTVFFDEIGELPLSMQPKLLRVLESRTVRRLGESTQRRIDARIVSATHRDLRRMVNEGSFREDLYFRLAVVPIAVPSLRERPEDIDLLAGHFSGAQGVLTPALLAELRSRPWLGNVRELRNFMERVRALGPREALQMTPAAGPMPGAGSELPAVRVDVPFKEIREHWLGHLEREYLKGMLQRHGRSISAIADAAGLDRTYIHRLLRKHEL